MIKLNEVKFSESSLVDSFGTVFYYQNRVYRAINSKDELYCIKLIESDLFKELSTLKLIPQTIIANIEIENYNLILEHEKILDSKPSEWSFSMFMDAAIHTLRVNEICNKYGYELKDAHPLNILFKGLEPVFIDIGSIVPRSEKDQEWVANDEFVKTFIIPLKLWQEGELYMVRLILESDFYQRIIPNQNLIASIALSGIIDKLTYSTLSLPYLSKPIRISKAFTKFSKRTVNILNQIYQKITSKKTSIFFVKEKFTSINEKLINDIRKKTVSSLWMDYHDEFIINNVEITDRFKKLIEIINENCNDIDTLIDLAGNQGFFSTQIIKKTNIKKVVVVDYDENAIDIAYKNFKSNKYQNVTTLLLNFMVPVDLKSTTSRLKSDLVIALAVSHHLFLGQGFSINAVFDRISQYSNKYVLIEFMPLGLWGGTESDSVQIPEWYNVDWFRKTFLCFFEILLEKQIETNRIAFLGKKR